MGAKTSYTRADLETMLATFDGGDPFMHTDLLSVMGRELPQDLHKWWRSEITSRLMDFLAFFDKKVDSPGIPRINNLTEFIVEPENANPILIPRSQLADRYSSFLNQNTANPEDSKKGFYNALRSRINLGTCIGCLYHEAFYPGFKPRKCKDDIFQIPFTLIAWVKADGNIEAIRRWANKRNGRQPFGEVFIPALCQKCYKTCDKCGLVMPLEFNVAVYNSFFRDGECLVCGKDKLTNIEPPKPNLKQLKVYKQKFSDLTR